MRMLICACMVALMAVAASAEVAKSECGCPAKKEAKAAMSNSVDCAKAAKKAAKKDAAAKKKKAAAAAEAAKAEAAK